MVPEPSYAWLDGRIVPWDDCVIHARSQGAFWGANVFEGIRAYRQASAGDLRLFRMGDHLRRLRRSMKFMRMEIAYSDDGLTSACLEVLAANGFESDAHIVITAYFGMGPNCDSMHLTDDTGVHITAISAVRPESYDSGATASISSWRRLSDDAMPPRIKTGANYHNSRLAQQEAVRNGYDFAILLNRSGSVAESSGACLVALADGILRTPPITSGAMDSITVDAMEQLAQRELGLTLRREEIPRTELYFAEEVFLCGTLAELLPIVRIDDLPIGGGVPGRVTRELQGLYDHAVRSIVGDRRPTK